MGVWVNNRRTNFRRRELAPETVVALEALPGWTWDPFEADFQEGLEALQEYVTREDHARVPPSHQEGAFPLGQWVSQKRRGYNKGKLPRERVCALEEIPGWTWDAFEAAFQEVLDALRQFVERNGHARVRQVHREGSFPLGKWVSRKRHGYKKGKLSRERAADLEEIPGWKW